MSHQAEKINNRPFLSQRNTLQGFVVFLLIESLLLLSLAGVIPNLQPLFETHLILIFTLLFTSSFLGAIWFQNRYYRRKKRLYQIIKALEETQFTQQLLPLSDSHQDDIAHLSQLLMQIQSHVQNECNILKNQINECAELTLVDPITQLKNRLQLEESLKLVIGRTQRNNYASALLFIDIDHFKEVNDNFGHKIGDKLLNLIARRLEKKIRKTDFLFRFEGDDFVIIYDHIGDYEYQAEEQIQKLSQYLIRELNQPYFIDQKEFLISFTIGAKIIAGIQKKSLDLADLAQEALQHAEVALNYLKNQKTSQKYAVFQQEMLESMHHLQLMESALTHALEQEELFWLIQPQINMQTHEVVGGEILLRWQHEGKLVSPVTFIPLAENTGLITPITYWLIKSVFIYIHTHQSDLKGQTFAINLSPVIFKDPDLMKNLHRLFSHHQIMPEQIKFEITEGVFLENIDHITKILQQIKDLGCQISLDDFGTGFSSLSYLKNLPIDQLKIDKSFLHQLLTDSKSSAIIKTIIDLSENLNINVIAEGIEYPEQAKFLIEHNCLLCQGFLYAKPLDPEHFLQFCQTSDISL